MQCRPRKEKGRSVLPRQAEPDDQRVQTGPYSTRVKGPCMSEQRASDQIANSGNAAESQSAEAAMGPRGSDGDAPGASGKHGCSVEASGGDTSTVPTRAASAGIAVDTAPPADAGNIHQTTAGVNRGTAALDPEQPRTRTTSGRSRKRGLLVLAAPLAVLALLYLADLIASSATVPRGVTVADVHVGGLGVDEAVLRLRAEIEPRTARPIPVTVGMFRKEIDPLSIGVSVDWKDTLAQAGSQPLNPITRIASFFTAREARIVSFADSQALRASLEELAPIVDKAPVEGSVRFEDDAPVPVDPKAGSRLDVNAAAEVLLRDWATGVAVALPVVEVAPNTSAEDVATAIDQVARPAVSAPVTIRGEGGIEGTLNQDIIAEALTFRAEDGQLVPEINQVLLIETLRPQLASSERPARDASFDLTSGTPVVVPSRDGLSVDYQATLAGLLAALTRTQERTMAAVYADLIPAITTAELEKLGIMEVIGEFQTGGFATDSGINIKRAAAQIDGTLVAPGETFSLNAATNPRTAATGYVQAGIIENGRPARGMGGGVSQVATTLFNAAYFAGMVDVEHQEHSFYIHRYPAGREATVFGDIIDVKFRNDGPTGVLIQTAWTPSTVTVRLFGTKRYDVTSSQGPRTNPTSPSTVTIPAGQPCSASAGSPGFTITDTRTLREITTGESRTETRTVRYNPSPKVICTG